MPVTWFRVVFDTEQYNYNIYEELEVGKYIFNSKFNKTDKLIITSSDPIIRIIDNTFSSGYFAVGCSDCAGIMFDYIQISHKTCLTKKSITQVKLIAPICGRW